VKRIRRKRRFDNMRTEIRAGGSSNKGRWVYLGLIVLLALWLFDTAFGHYLYLRAEGLVTQDKHVIAISNIATVDSLYVEEGQDVSKDQPLAKITSFPIVQQIANLSTKLADIHSRQLDLKARRAVLNKVTPLAQRRVEEMAQLLSTQEAAIRRGLTTTSKIHELLQYEFDSILESESMQAEASNIDKELSELSLIAERLTRTLKQIQQVYADGVVHAPENGKIVNLKVSRGSVVSGDSPLMEVLIGHPYVLAYVKPGALYAINGGEAVGIRYGLSTVRGRISAILPFSAKLPSEFQRTFRPQERSQIIRIELEDSAQPPTYTKVEAVSGSILWNKLKSFAAGLSSFRVAANNP
jgi:multidrug resistance efflux pump